MLRYFATSLLFLGAAFLLPENSTGADAPKTKITFDQHVLPVFRDKCLACHNQDKAKGGLDLSTFSATMEGGASGVVVKPGDAEASRLYRLTAHKEMPYMPPQSPVIAKESLDILSAWINQGALENAGSKAAPVKPKVDVSLKSVTRGKPEGPPPMPPVSMKKDLVVKTEKANSVIAMASAPWSPLVAVGGQKQVLLYHADTFELLGVLPFAHGTPHVLKFSRNGSLLLVGGGRGGKSGKVVVFDIRSGEQIIEVGNETDAVLAADISADQALIALGGPSKMLRIYSTKDGQILREVKKHTDWIYAVEFSPDAVLLATADRSGGLYVWEADTGREFYSLRGHTAGITDLAWRDDSNILASCSEDGTIRTWEMENGNQTKSWAAHGGGTQSVRFSHDNRLVSTGRDKVTKVWDANGAVQKAFDASADVGLRAAFTHDNLKVVSGDWTGEAKFFVVADGKQTGAVTTNPQTPAEKLAAATKLVAEKQALADTATAAFNAATAALQKANLEVAPAVKLAADSAAQAKANGDAANAAKANADKLTATLAAGQSKLTALNLKLAALNESFAKIKAAADAAKGNVDLAAAVAELKPLIDKAVAEQAAAAKVVTETTPLATQAAAALAPAQKAAADSAAAAKLAAEILAPKMVVVTNATNAMNLAKGVMDQAVAVLGTAKAELAKLQPPPPVVPPVKK